MTALRPEPIHWSEFVQAEEPHVERITGWPLVGIWAAAVGLSLACWWGVLAAIHFIAAGPA